MGRRGVFPCRFLGPCRLEPCFEGGVTSEIVQSAGGLHEHVLKVCPEVSADVSCDAEDLDSGDAVFDAHTQLRDAAVGLLFLVSEFAPLGLFLGVQDRDPLGFTALKAGVLPES
jgi:hypothetical protein